MLVAGALALLVIFWIFPGIKETIRISREAEKDWPGFLFPIAFVIMFVIFLIAMV